MESRILTGTNEATASATEPYELAATSNIESSNPIVTDALTDEDEEMRRIRCRQEDLREQQKSLAQLRQIHEQEVRIQHEELQLSRQLDRRLSTIGAGGVR